MAFIQLIAEFITLKIIAMALLILSFLWILKLYMKRQREYLFRASLIFTILFLSFIFLQRNEIGKWNFYEIKGHIFPEKPVHCNYHLERGSLTGENYVRYIFEDPKPKLSLSLDNRGKYLNLRNVSSVNAVLKSLGLPRVTARVPELASITGSRFDIKLYRWDDYPKGTLVIERTQCKNKKSLQFYYCIASITIKEKY